MPHHFARFTASLSVSIRVRLRLKKPRLPAATSVFIRGWHAVGRSSAVEEGSAEGRQNELVPCSFRSETMTVDRAPVFGKRMGCLRIREVKDAKDAVTLTGSFKSEYGVHGTD